MESNWRLNIIRFGQCGRNAFNRGDDWECLLMAELESPFILTGYLVRWIVQYREGNFVGNSLGLASLLTPDYCQALFSVVPSPFPGGFAVLPD